MQHVLFFVGPDMSGKTQIAKELSRRTGIPYFKASSEHSSYLTTRTSKSEDFLYQLRYADPRVLDLFRQGGFSLIFDRGYPCESVYSRVFRRQTDEGMLQYLDEEWSKLGAKIVLCYRSCYSTIVDDLDPSIKGDVLQRIHNEYFQFLQRTKCDSYLLCVDDENLDREVSEIQAWCNI